MEIWPNLFIVGAIRAGTTSLYEYLKEVPSVYMTPIKEPNFFIKNVDRKQLHTKPITNKKKYLNLFSKAKNETVIGEASPTYLWDPDSPKLIKNSVSHAKIIIILRNPIERAYSHYLMLLGHGSINLSFEESIAKSIKLPRNDFSSRIISAGMYYDQVKRYYEIFELNKIKVIIFEEFVSNPLPFFKSILKFLEVEEIIPPSLGKIYNQFTLPRGKISSRILQNTTVKKMGKKFIPMSLGELAIKKVLGKKSEKPELSDEIKTKLEEIYHDDIKKLELLLRRSLPWTKLNN